MAFHDSLRDFIGIKGYDSGGTVQNQGIGGLTDWLGVQNRFQAQAPVNQFQSTSPVQPGTLGQANTQAQGGAGPASGTIAQQSALSQSLADAAAGGGPNPALERLHTATSANINNAAGMAASARGINPALAARMAVDSAATSNQAAAGQAATMTAEQQIAAREQLGRNLAQTGQLQLGQQTTGIQGLGTAGGLDLSSQGLNAQTAAQNAQLGLGAQQINAGIAAENTNINKGVLGGLANAAGAVVGGAVGGPIGAAAANMLLGGGGSGVGGASGAGVGGAVGAATGLAQGGVASEKPPLYSYLDSVHSFSNGGEAGPSGDLMPKSNSQPAMGAAFSHGGSIHHSVPAMLSPGEKVLPPGTTPEEAAHQVSSKPRVPGHADVQGDSPKNDTVHARLSVGSIVLPRSVVNSKNPGKAASSFVASLMKRHGGRSFANGGRVTKDFAPKPTSEMHDYSKGGYVGTAEPTESKESSKNRGTARGVGRDENKRRMTTSSKPKYQEAD